MSIPYSELTAETVENLEIDSSDLSRYQVVEKLNLVQLKLLNTLPFRYLTSAIKTTNFNLLASSNPDNHLLKFPDEFIRFVEAYIDYSNPITRDNPGKKMTIYNPEKHINPISAIGTVNYPFIDPEKENGFEIAPAPTSAVTNGGLLKFVYKLPAIDTNQPSLLSYNLKPLLINGATQLCAMVDNYRPDLAKMHGDLFEKDLAVLMPAREK